MTVKDIAIRMKSKNYIEVIDENTPDYHAVYHGNVKNLLNSKDVLNLNVKSIVPLDFGSISLIF